MSKKKIAIAMVSIFAVAVILMLGMISHTPVFMYHSVSDVGVNGDMDMSITPDMLRSHLEYLKMYNYEYIFVKDIREFEYKRNKIALTFDDGYEDNYTVVFPMLKEFNAKATIFVPTDFIGKEGYLTREQIIEMQESGYVDIESHTVRHDNLNNVVSTEELEFEVRESKRRLEEILDKPVDVISYPGGYENENVNEISARYYKKGVLAKPTHKFRLLFDPMQIERLGIYMPTKYSEIETVCKRSRRTYIENVCVKCVHLIRKVL